MLHVIMLHVIMLNIMLNVIMLNVIMLNVIMLNATILNVIMLRVMAPFLSINLWLLTDERHYELTKDSSLVVWDLYYKTFLLQLLH